MSDIPLGYYILYQQNFGDGGPSQAMRVGPFDDEDTARRTLMQFLSSADPDKTDFRFVLRQETEIVLGQGGS